MALSFLCLFTISACAQGSEQSENLLKYKNTINSLNASNKESILNAKEEFYKYFMKDDKASEEGFRIFRDFYVRVINEKNSDFMELSNIFFEEPAFYEIIKGTYNNPLMGFEKLSKMDKDRIKRKYSTQLKEITGYLKSGMKISGNDGDGYYLAESFEFLTDILKNYQFDLAKFFQFMKEEETPIAIDAGLQIPWDDLRKKFLRFEKFSRDYPNLKETKEYIEPKIKELFGVYLTGLDNSPAFDWESRKLDSELKKSYEIFLIENKNSSYFEILRNYYTILEKDNFKDSDQVRKYVSDLNLW
jgi:hypothetical protein